MSFRNLFRYFSLRNLTSNVEVIKEIKTTNQPTFSEIESAHLKNYQVIRYSKERFNSTNEYLNSKPSFKALKGLIPASYFLKNPTNKYKSIMFLVDKDVACDILKCLHPHLKTHNGHVMEFNAGVGVLTEELLKAQIPNLRIYEPDAQLCNHILKLVKCYKSDARLFMANLLALGSMMNLDRKDNGERAKALLDGLPSMSWEDEPVVKLVGAVRDRQFIRHIMFSIMLQSGICEHGRPELFLILPTKDYEKLIARPKEEKGYRGNSVIFQILFDHELLLRVPGKGFIPWSIAPKPKKATHQFNEIYEDLCLVKMTPKKELLQTVPPDLLKPLWFFVKSLMHKKSSLLIEQIEKWIPGSGVRLISKGYTIFTDCGSLTPDEYLKIYLEFTSWPEFHSCSFLPSVEALLSKFLQYSILEEIESDEKFNKLLNKESNVSEDDVYIFDDSTDFQHRNKKVGMEERST